MLTSISKVVDFFFAPAWRVVGYAAFALSFGVLAQATLKYSIDIPFWDEWVCDLTPNGLAPAFNLEWIIGRCADNRMVFQRLIVWLLYRTTDFNFYIGSCLNLVLYLAMAGAIYLILQPLAKQFPLFLLYFVPLFSGMVPQQLIWSVNSQLLSMYLFSYLAVYFGFIRDRSLLNTALFTACCVASAWAMAPPMVIGIVVVYAVCESVVLAGANWRYLAKRIVVPVTVIVVMIAFELRGQPTIFATVMPWDHRFLKFFVMVLYTSSTGIMWVTRFPVHMVAFTVAFAVALLCEARAQRLYRDRFFYALLAVFAGTALTLAAVAFGRSSSLSIPTQQHLQPGLNLIPFIAASLAIFTARGGRPLQFAVMGLYFVVLVIGFHDRFDMKREFAHVHNSNAATLQKASGYYLRGADGIVPGHPYDEVHLDEAADLGLSFVRRIMKDAPATPLDIPLPLTSSGSGLALLRAGWYPPDQRGVEMVGPRSSLMVVRDKAAAQQNLQLEIACRGMGGVRMKAWSHGTLLQDKSYLADEGRIVLALPPPYRGINWTNIELVASRNGETVPGPGRARGIVCGWARVQPVR